MEHEPYLEWLFSEAALTGEQRRALQEHLLSCESCASLAAAWEMLPAAVHALPEASPAPGFTQRWLERRVQERIREQRRLTLLVLLLCVGGALVTLAALALPQLGGSLNLVTATSSIIHTAASIGATLGDIEAVGEALLLGLPLVVPVFFWIVFAMTACIWTFLWLLGVWRIPHLQRSHNENTD